MFLKMKFSFPGEKPKIFHAFYGFLLYVLFENCYIFRFQIFDLLQTCVSNISNKKCMIGQCGSSLGTNQFSSCKVSLQLGERVLILDFPDKYLLCNH